MSWKDEVDAIHARRALARAQGGEAGVARQHAQGRLTIRERIDALLDADSFDEVGMGAGEAELDEDGRLVGFSPANFVLGFGAIAGRPCVVGGEDFTLRGGSPSPAGLHKSIYTELLAVQSKVPLIRLHEGAGGSVGAAQGRSRSSASPVYAPARFRSVAEALRTVPVASAALGPVAGLPAARLVASHFSVMARTSAQVMVAGPAVVQRALGAEPSKAQLGGAEVHGPNGTVDHIAADELDALAQIRRFLSYLPANVWALPPVEPAPGEAGETERAEALLDIVPRARERTYDMRRLLGLVLDRESFFEMGRAYGRGQITGLGRLAGHPVGVWANDCRHLAGALTADGSHKARRFLSLCETFHLPIVTFIDEPGFMVGVEAERASTIRHGTDLVLQAAMTRVPWAAVLIRRSFGVGQTAHYGPEPYVLAWPSAEVGPLPVEGGVAVAYRRQIAAADDPDAMRRALEAQLAAKQSPFPRAEAFAFHELIDPRETRPMLSRWVKRAQMRLPALLPGAG